MGSPSEIILKRFDAFIQNSPEGIYDCYAENSEFIKFFPEKKDYCSFFEELKKETLPIKITIVKTETKQSLARVSYIETFMTLKEGKIDYFSKTTLTKTENGWKIIKEERDKIIQQG